MFYEFRQNNSGGRFSHDESQGISVEVVVEATSASEANMLAEEIGLYFHGVEEGWDCPSCGDRWYEADDSDGTSVPTLYGQPVSEQAWEKLYGGRGAIKWIKHGHEGFIHYKDGRVEGFWLDK